LDYFYGSVTWEAPILEFLHDCHSSFRLCQWSGSFGFRIMSMFVFIPGLPQRVAMIPDPDDQGTHPQWTMIIVGKWFLVNSKMLFLILQPFHGESA
jgi:hypothetical protein